MIKTAKRALRSASYSVFGVLLLSVFVSSSAHAWFFNSNYTKTKHPIVLVHGMVSPGGELGMYRIPNRLRDGGAQVYMLNLSVNTNEVRGEQAARQIEDILAASGASKVNLIGHSQGGPTARYVASVYPSYVASVTTMSGVNFGSALADAIVGSGFVPGALYDAFDGIYSLFTDIAPHDLETAANAITTWNMATFNANYPEGLPSTYCGEGSEVGSNGVRYYSFAGHWTLTNAADISDPLLAVTSLAYREPNDGAVAVCESRLGRTIRDDLRMNHMDEVNHLFGLHGILDSDPITIYRQHANRLKNMGL